MHKVNISDGKDVQREMCNTFTVYYSNTLYFDVAVLEFIVAAWDKTL